MDIHQEIKSLIQKASTFSANDVLVHLKTPLLIEIPLTVDQFTLPFETHLHKLFLLAKQAFKESGNLPICVGENLLDWEYKNKKIQTPIFLNDFSMDYQSIDQTYSCALNSSWFINPFLVNHFHLKNTEGDLAELKISFFEEVGKYQLEFEIIDLQYVGNFHHHRFSIVKELEELSLMSELNPNIAQIFGFPEKHERLFTIPELAIIPLDFEQQETLHSVMHQNTVVKGPPGTGKSQVISALISNTLMNGAHALVVSEKHAALAVLKKKMEQLELSSFCHLITQPNCAKDFVLDLKQSWELLEKNTVKEKSLHSNRIAYLNQLEGWWRILNHPEIIGGVSYTQFIEWKKNYDFDALTFQSIGPDLLNWEKNRNIVSSIYDQKLDLVLQQLNPNIWHTDQIFSFDQKLKEFEIRWVKFSEKFQIHTFLDFQNQMRNAVLCATFALQSLQKYPWILSVQTLKIKKFHSLKKRFTKLNLAKTKIEKDYSKWKIIPGKMELVFLKNLIQKNGFFHQLKAKKLWQKYSESPYELAVSIIDKFELQSLKEDELKQIEIEFCELNIDEAELEIPIITQLLNEITQEKNDQWQKIPKEIQPLFIDSNVDFSWWNTVFKTYFCWEEQAVISQELNNLMSKFGSVMMVLNDIRCLDKSHIEFYKNNKNFASYEAQLLHSNWIKFIQQYPYFSNFELDHLILKLDEIEKEEKIEQIFFQQQVLIQQRKKFTDYENLLRAVPARLSVEDKNLRSRLKNGKSILVKAFKKSRQFPSIRTLLSSDAQLWIAIMKPIILGNPSQIGKHIPLSMQFSFGILDEAGQIPLQNSLGTLQRCARILVAGDEQQMSPTTYFSSEGEDSVDLLHQALYYWPKTKLINHYRSEHASLIAFSNQYFYNNELIAFPSFAPNAHPLKFTFIQNGIYHDGINEKEAKAIAADFTHSIDVPEIIGLVAFSEAQLQCIYANFSGSIKDKIQMRIENNTCFFKTLEHVQGDECDLLWISMGYGKNKAGDFHLRFGPINKSNGAKRLNVLFSRAKKQINLFTSVQSQDFGWTENEGVQLLKNYLVALENQQLINQISQDDFPYHLKPEILGNKLIFNAVFSQLPNVSSFKTLISVLQIRGWQVGLK